MKTKFFLLILAACSIMNAGSQVLRAFSPRYNNVSVRGSIVYVSNSIISTFGIGPGTPGTGELPPAGTSNNGTTAGMNTGINIDIDADATTFNSSSSDLTIGNLPSCSQILFAGLYWGAGTSNGGVNTSWITGETTCQLKLPGASTYITITSSQTDHWNSTTIPGFSHTGFQCFADITSLINSQTTALGTYTVANVASPAGKTDAYGGWTIVIAYSNSSLQLRNLTVFDGSAAIKAGNPSVDVDFSGFLTPASGPVSCELGAVVYDGDRNFTDSFEFKQSGAATFLDLTPNAAAPGNATSKIADMWNSTISYKGVVVTTRSPAFQNTLGYDADIITVPNTGNANLGNGKSSATVRFKSPNESYIVSVLTTSISQYNPIFSFVKTATDINGGSLNPGDNLRYQITYNNVGDDVSTASVIYDNIPAGTAFVPGSIKIDGISKTEAAGDDEAEYDFINNRIVFRVGTGANSSSGGSIALGGSGTVQFDVTVASSCSVLSCNPVISNSARISYSGFTSLNSLYDSSGVDNAGCISRVPTTSTVTSACYTPLDTLLVNTCPLSSVVLPYAKYAGYVFYSAMPFTAANLYNQYIPVATTHTYYAYYNAPGGCSDTIKINVYISGCPNIDDDKDGIPDYVEINLPAATQDADNDGVPNWMDSDYLNFVDNNADGFNDNFDPAADSDNDGIPNFLDRDFPGFIDINNDDINDNVDSDLDGIPNNFDLDSDNDGIPDVVEAGGVDTDGDGRLDNYSDSDNDGLSQNVDNSNSGIIGSGYGLGLMDTDSDGVPDYLDIDSDNDGIPDVVEVYGMDVNNDGRIDNYTDSDGDGYSDSVDGDAGNDGIAENTSSSLLSTGIDINGDGRADSYPNKNIDNDSKPNPYDLDSDGDGITDVEEGFPGSDTNNDGRIDGPSNNNGWHVIVSAMSLLNLPNTDGRGKENVYDIDADDDGIPDNIEGLPTAAYHFPSGSDADNDGIDDSYDNFLGFGGNGIPPVDTDGDGLPDYKDADTDGDGSPDIYEGNDFNNNGNIDDGVALTGTDSDEDGLDDYFDLLNTSKGTSSKMGNAGSMIGDSVPGSKTIVQRNAINGCPFERDWRCVPFILNCKTVVLKASLQKTDVLLDWLSLCGEDINYFVIERSKDGINYNYDGLVKKSSDENKKYQEPDDISSLSESVVFYRLKIVSKSEKISYSNSISVPLLGKLNSPVIVFPNPVKDELKIAISSAGRDIADIKVYEATGKEVLSEKKNLVPGKNLFGYPQAKSFPAGIYFFRIKTTAGTSSGKFSIAR